MPTAETETDFDPTRDRFRGSLVGLAVGDALGATVEFKKPGSFVPPTELVGGGPFKLKPGEWTDDTSQALCLAESLVERGGFNAGNCMSRLYRWMTQGHLSVNGKCFDIGTSASASLREFGRTGDPYQGRPDRDTNGALMRLAPVPLTYAGLPGEAIRYAELATKMTHGGAETIAASRYLAGLLVGAACGAGHAALFPPGALYVPCFDPQSWRNALTDSVASVGRGEHPATPRAGFSALACLDAAIWAVRGAADFESAVCRAVALGEDSDTVGAVAGQLAGAIWGHRSIPQRWRDGVAWHDRIVATADGLYALSGLGRDRGVVP